MTKELKESILATPLGKIEIAASTFTDPIKTAYQAYLDIARILSKDSFLPLSLGSVASLPGAILHHLGKSPSNTSFFNYTNINKDIKEKININIAPPKYQESYFFSLPNEVVAASEISAKNAWLQSLYVAEFTEAKGLTILKNTPAAFWGLAFGLATWSPFYGAIYSIVQAVSSLTIMGNDPTDAILNLKIFLPKSKQKNCWDNLFALFMGAFWVQYQLGIAPSNIQIELTELPNLTLLAEAISKNPSQTNTKQHFCEEKSHVVLVPVLCNINEMPRFDELRQIYLKIRELSLEGYILSAKVMGEAGLAHTISQMCALGQKGLEMGIPPDLEILFTPDIGSMILELSSRLFIEELEDLFENIPFEYLAKTVCEPTISFEEFKISTDEILAALKI